MTWIWHIIVILASCSNNLSDAVEMGFDDDVAVRVSPDAEVMFTRPLMRSHHKYDFASSRSEYPEQSDSLLQTQEGSIHDTVLDTHLFRLRLLTTGNQTRSDNAVVTHICDDEWVPGALALAGSLKKFRLKTNLVIMIPENVSVPMRELLATVFDHVYLEEPIVPHPAVQRPNGDCLTLQLRAWQLPYKKVLYLDADMIAFRSPEILLWTYGEMTAQKDNRKEFNGGMFICEPNSSTFDVLAHRLRTYQRETGKRPGIQPFMNAAFPTCNTSGPPARSYGHAGCWGTTFNKTQNRFSRMLNSKEIELLMTGTSAPYGTVHFSGDWETSVKPWMPGCMAAKDSTTKQTELHKSILDLWMNAFKQLEIPASMQHLIDIKCPAFKCAAHKERLDYVMFAEEFDCVTKKAVQSLQQYASPRQIIIIAPKKICADFLFHIAQAVNSSAKTHCFDEDALLADVTRSSVEAWLLRRFGDGQGTILNASGGGMNSSRMAGWFLQKFLKMGLANMKPKSKLGKHYVLWDSGTVMLRDFCPFTEDGRVNIMEASANSQDRCLKNHERAFSQLAGLNYAYSAKKSLSYSSNHLVVRKTAMSQFLRVIRHNSSPGMHWTHSILHAVCPTLEDCACGFPEMAAYASWLKSNHPQLMSEVPAQIGNAEDKDPVLLANGSISFIRRIPCCPDQHVYAADIANGHLAIRFNRSASCGPPPPPPPSPQGTSLANRARAEKEHMNRAAQKILGQLPTLS